MRLVLHIYEALRLFLVRSAAQPYVYVLIVDSKATVGSVAGVCVRLRIGRERHVTCEAVIVVYSLLQVVDLLLVDDCASVELLVLG